MNYSDKFDSKNFFRNGDVNRLTFDPKIILLTVMVVGIEHTQNFEPFPATYLLKSIYRSFSVLRLIINEPNTKIDFRRVFTRPEKVLVSV